MRVAPHTVIDEREIDEQFVHASGPGGQNVNKVSTAVQLRFNAAASAALPAGVRERLLKLAGSRATTAGEIVIIAQQYRTQSQNRADARARLAAMIAKAWLPPKLRKPTKPSRASKRRRLETKHRIGGLKRLRAGKIDQD